MTKLGIAWRSIQQRGLASILTAASMGLGVMLVVMVLSIHGIVAKQFLNNASLGYNLIVGAKGGKLQLTLNSVYYLSQPIENISYEFFSEFFGEEQRDEMWSSSLASRGSEAALAASAWMQCATPGGGLGALAALTADPHGHGLGLAGAGRPGKYADLTGFAVPLCLGDYYGRFRVVGTTPDFFTQLVRPDTGEPLVMRAGRAFHHVDEQNGFFEAVVGSMVANEMKIGVNDEFSPAHGDPEGEGHEQTFRVVGVLAPSGTPNDRVVFVNMEGFYLMSSHAKPLENNDPFAAALSGAAGDSAGDSDAAGDPADQAAATGDDAAGESAASEDVANVSAAGAHYRQRTPLPLEQREVTAILLRTQHVFYGMQLTNVINEGKEAQCVQPTKEIYDLMDSIVRPFQNVLLLLAVLICIVSGISILVSMYNSMSDRQHEIAVMRALGARRGTVMAIILIEAVILALGGGVGGWIAGHGVNSLLSGQIEARTGVLIGFFDLAPPVNLLEVLGGDAHPWLNVSSELLLIPALIVLAILVGFLPALAGYRTDVGKQLSP